MIARLKILATLHTNDAPSAVNRLTDMGVESFLTSSAVDRVIAQRVSRESSARAASSRYG